MPKSMPNEKAGVFKAFFDALASMSPSAHLIQMFDSTIVRPCVGSGCERGQTVQALGPLTWRIYYENPRKSRLIWGAANTNSYQAGRLDERYLITVLTALTAKAGKL